MVLDKSGVRLYYVEVVGALNFISGAVLEGVTRRTVIEVCETLDVDCRTTKFRADTLRSDDEVFYHVDRRRYHTGAQRGHTPYRRRRAGASNNPAQGPLLEAPRRSQIRNPRAL